MLTLKDVSASYGAAPVISGISAIVVPGEICAVLGANGAGKTTLLRAIMGLVPSISGTISGPEGRVISGLQTWQIVRSGVGYVQEGRGILYSLTVRENLLVGATPLLSAGRAACAARFAAVLEEFPMLKPRLDDQAGLLSGGQQQMLAIARALISQPHILMLDEPSLGLAPRIRRQISDILLEIRARGNVAVLLVEQDIKLAQRCADRAFVLRRGRLSSELSGPALQDREVLRQAYLTLPAAQEYAT